MSDNIYHVEFLQNLFDEMQSTYERVSNITSFGFNLRWRRQLVNAMNLKSGMVVADLMGGSGETWQYILPKIGDEGELWNVDFSRAMCDFAHKRHARIPQSQIHILQEDALSSSIPDHSVDAVLCIYGIKTLNPDLYASFAQEIQRILKPDGRYGLVEISVPSFILLRLPYMLYLRLIIPIFGFLLLGNHRNYRMLSRYTSHFQNCHAIAQVFAQQGLVTNYHHFFFGCCSAVTGHKPSE